MSRQSILFVGIFNVAILVILISRTVHLMIEVSNPLVPISPPIEILLSEERSTNQTKSISSTSIFSQEQEQAIVPKSSFHSNWTHEWLIHRTQGERARILLVHVGKTGGVSLYRSIPVYHRYKTNALQCLMDKTINNTVVVEDSHNSKTTPLFDENQWANCYKPPGPQAVLGEHIVSHKHTSSRLYTKKLLHFALFTAANTFLVTTRNPVSRIVSAFNFHYNQTLHREEIPNIQSITQKFFVDCFPTMDALALRLITARRSSNHTSAAVMVPTESANSSSLSSWWLSLSCVDLAKSILQGSGPQQNFRGRDIFQHFNHNYQFYARETLNRRPELPVVVIRTEHLWDDAQRLDRALGGNGTFARLEYISHGSESYRTQSGIRTREGMIAICCELVPDIKVYQSIILQALNLNHSEKMETLKGAFRECGIRYSLDAVHVPFSWSDWYNRTCQRQQQQSTNTASIW